MATDRERPTRGPNPRTQAAVDPTPANPQIFKFLLCLFDEGSYPEKVILNAAHGPTGMKLGPTVKEIPFKPNSPKPTREQLVAMSNQLMQLAQEDCDVLGKPTTRYVVGAYDLARSDRAYGRVLVALHPSGTSQMLTDERGGGSFDDEEGGTMPTKLMLSLLADERKDKRWLMETVANLVSGSQERDAARIERLEQSQDSVFERSVKYMAATEQMLNQSEDRKRLAENAKFKQEIYKEGWEWIKSFGPAVQVYLSNGKHGIVEGLENFIRSLGSELEEKLMGRWNNEILEQPGILDEDQVKFLAGIIERKIDPKRLPEMAASLRPEQMMAAQELLGQQKIMALGAIFKAATDVVNKEAEKNGAQA